MKNPAEANRPDPPPSNRLAHETSPYLLQHAHNPVDWYPWGSEALERAQREDKPIFLSIGYSACHWCHVMEHESFENPGVAALMNESFVCIKVDREERPDLDEIYMKAVQLLTGGGGWPMSVWLTPDGRPFYGGTYFPPEDRFGRAGFPRVLKEMARLWKDDRKRVLEAADGLTQEIRRISVPAPAKSGGAGALDPELVRRCARDLLASFDETYGGFGQAPKFPHAMELELLFRVHARFGDEAARDAALFTLGKMAAGGIYDQLGGGFHRYSTDERWLVPHFEKMLYDNALLANAYLDAFLVTKDPEHARIVREILEWALREMTSPEGGFYSTQDADSEGEEGKYFVWDPAELARVLGEEQAAWIAAFFGVSASGNFEHGKSVLSRPWRIGEFARAKGMDEKSVASGVEAARAKLLAERARRIAPARDDKVLADWNGLIISAFARAGFHLSERRYVEAARRAAGFARTKLMSASGLLRSYKDGRARHTANLADHALLAEGVLDLYEATFDPSDLAFAKELVDATLARFADEKDGGFFSTAHDHEPLLARSKEAYDGATPSGPSVLVMDLLRLAEMTGDERLRAKAEQTLALHLPMLTQRPQAAPRMLAAVDFLQSRPREIVLAGADLAALEPFLATLRSVDARNQVVLAATPATIAALSKLTTLLEGRSPDPTRALAYVCREGVCKLPIFDPAAFAQELATGK